MSTLVTPTTYDELLEAISQKEEATKNFKTKFYDYIYTCIREAGFINKWVKHKSTGVVGKLEIQQSGWSPLYPFELKFFAVTKKGVPSQRPTYVAELGYIKHKELLNILVNNFEVVGDINEG